MKENRGRNTKFVQMQSETPITSDNESDIRHNLRYP